jgi:hypothetical protein
MRGNMTIADRVEECISKYNSNDLDNALIQLCIAFDGTAKNEFPGNIPNNQRYKSFLSDNMDIISYFTFNTNVFFNCKFGDYTFERIIYGVIRCELLHEEELSKRLVFIEPGEQTTISNEQWRLPKTFVYGSLLTVIGAKTNYKQKANDKLFVKILGKQFQVNKLWGQGKIIRNGLGLIKL